MRIGIAGVNGRMGRMLVAAVRGSGDALAGGIDRSGAPDGVDLMADIAALASAADVVIDFTRPESAPEHAAALQAAGTAWVLGTTGLDTAAQAAVLQAAGRVPVVQAANFSVGVTLLLALAERMAAALPSANYDAEILEMHHRQKIDAPSGTALAFGMAVARGRGVDLASVAQTDRAGVRKDGEIGFASLRAGQVVGEHTLSFSSGSEQIQLTHRAFDRAGFAEGAVRAAQWVQGRTPGLYGMQHVLGLS
jgi:4-hydroxy-tetrahydrodipicolinate reductase